MGILLAGLMSVKNTGNQWQEITACGLDVAQFSDRTSYQAEKASVLRLDEENTTSALCECSIIF